MTTGGGKQPKFVIGREGFSTKKDVVQRIKAIKDHAPLGVLKGADRTFCMAFFTLHPNAKKVKNLQEIFVSIHPRGHRQFEVLCNGERLDISYQKPLRTLTGLDSHRADVLSAMRQAVHPQILAFRAKVSPDFNENLVVDHQWPHTFDALVKRFLEEEDATFADIKLRDNEDRHGRILTGYWLRAWTEFHKESAVLRLANREENSRWGNREPKQMKAEVL